MITGKQNASAFHEVTTAFCTIKNQPSAKNLQIPEISHLTKMLLEDDDEEERMELQEEIWVQESAQNSDDYVEEDSGNGDSEEV